MKEIDLDWLVRLPAPGEAKTHHSPCMHCGSTAVRNAPRGTVSYVPTSWGSNGTDREAQCIRECALNALGKCKVLSFSLSYYWSNRVGCQTVSQGTLGGHCRRLRDLPFSDKASSLLSVFYVSFQVQYLLHIGLSTVNSI